ncbi:MAG: hypothetical protein WBF06_11695 [Candidatus Acidiferrales bacterium]
MPISAADAINPAFEHTKQQLLHPFRFAQWARLALVGFLAGELGSGGCNFNSAVPNLHGKSQPFPGTALPPEIANHFAAIAALIAGLAVIGLGLTLLFLYIGSVMRFILFDSVVAKQCHIREGWSRRRSHGRRLFVWQLWFLLATFAALIILIGIPAACAWSMGWFTHPGDHVLPLVLGGIVVFSLFAALLVALVVIQVFTKDFVVPQMALEDITAVEGWRRLWLLLKAEKGGYAGYIGMKIVLAIAASIVLGIATVILVLVLLIPVGGVGVIAVLGGKAAGLSWTVSTIALAVIAGCLALAILIFAIALINVPAIVFFPAYSIYFFAARYPPLAALLQHAPPA